MIKRFAMFALLLGIFVVPALAATVGASAHGNSAAAKACQQGGYANLQGTDGTLFANTGECVSYAAHGGELIDIPVVLPQIINVSFTPTGDPSYCGVAVELISFPANSTISVVVDVSGYVYNASMTTDATGYVFGYPIGTYYQFSGAVVTVSAGGLTSGSYPISC